MNESWIGKVGDLPVIGAFAPLATEVDVTPLLRALARAGFPLALPICEPPVRVMSWAAWDGDMGALRGQSPLHFRPGPSLASDGPSDQNDAVGRGELFPDIVIVPLVAFDHQLQRLGRGGGFYDATLCDLHSRKKIVSIGLAYDVQSLSTSGFAGYDAEEAGGLTYQDTSSEGAAQQLAPSLVTPSLDWAEPHDMALDIVLTECNILRHGKEF